jgi:hypothetical protein
MSNVTWQAQANLSQVVPATVTSTVTGINTFLTQKVNPVITEISKIVSDLGFLFSSPTDILLSLLKNFSTPVIQALSDALGLGGGLIVIHPWNRMNKRLVNSSSDPVFPFNVPAMNVQEAFNELYASFSNTNDPYRPQWGTNDTVAGMGMLIVAPDPSIFLNLIVALQQLLDIKEFSDIIEKYSKAAISWNRDTAHQMGSPAATAASFDITGITNLKFQNVISNTGTLQSPLVSDTVLPSLHWFGLSLSNFTFLNQISNGIKLIINKLTSLLQTSDNPIGEFIKVLFKKVTALINVITTISSVLSGLLITLQNTGFYFFEISPMTGGVQAIISQIQQSLSNPTGDAQILASHLTDSNFCMLAFMGAGYGVNLNAWKAMFMNAFDQNTTAAQALINQATINYAIVPNFKNAVFFFDTPITLIVSSQDSSSQHQYYYTYKVTDSSGNIIASFLNKIQGGNTLQVNGNPVTLKFSHPLSNPKVGTISYTITIEIFDFLLFDTTYTATFSVTDEVSSFSTFSLDALNHAICINANKQGTVQIVDNNKGYALESSSVKGGATACIGTTIGPNSTNIQLKFIGADNSSFFTDIMNNLGYAVGNVNSLPIPNSFKFLSFPAKICFKFTGVLKYQAVGASTWTYVTLPSCILISGLGCYNYYVFTPATGWSSQLSFCIVQQVTAGTQVC